MYIIRLYILNFIQVMLIKNKLLFLLVHTSKYIFYSQLYKKTYKSAIKKTKFKKTYCSFLYKVN